MAVSTRLQSGIDDRVIENATHIKVHDTVTYTTINTRYRVTDRPPCSDGSVVAGITTLAYNIRARMVGIG